MSAMVGMLGNDGDSGSAGRYILTYGAVAAGITAEKAAAALEDLKVSVADSTGKMKEMPQLLAEISAAFESKGSAASAT